MLFSLQKNSSTPQDEIVCGCLSSVVDDGHLQDEIVCGCLSSVVDDAFLCTMGLAIHQLK
jgi:hypothetical protein